MANHLKMAEVHAIQVLREQGWSQRRIARELGIHRDTVARYLRLGRECQGAGVVYHLKTGQRGAGENRPSD